MRAIGYSFDTAVADIADNSIAASASRIEIFFGGVPSPCVALLDNGTGMLPAKLFESMRHGSQDPDVARAETDLGRFGLGLKTASLSQCRQLTVISKTGSSLCGAQWDLDEVVRSRDWYLLELDESEIGEMPHIQRLLIQTSGTLVIWRGLDRALAGESDEAGALMRLMDQARHHVALVFHRYMEPGPARITFSINELEVKPLDPFLMGAPGRQTLPVEPLEVGGHQVRIEPHILPHISKLSAEQISRAGGEDGLRRNQGFYVYRMKRLITWGTWFKLARQEEMSKLARVAVDIPNTLDHLWSLDVKKSTAYPPEQVRKGLQRIVERISERSKRVYTFRGNRGWAADLVPMWKRHEMRQKNFRYEINREHQLFAALINAIPEEAGPILERFVQLVEDTFPYDAVYADMASDHRSGSDEALEDRERKLTDVATQMVNALSSEPQARKSILDKLHLLEPFNLYPEITTRIKEKFA